MEHDGAIYTFSRGQNDEGRWVCIGGRHPSMVGGAVYNSYVHLDLNTELCRVAVGKGLGERKEFARYLKREKKPVRVTRPKKRRARKSGLFGGGVSLSSFFDSVDIEERHEVTEYEEIETRVSR
jgi:hypothetical protein